MITMECGKTLEDARGEMQRAIENVEVACGIPTLMKGEYQRRYCPRHRRDMLRQPVGVCAAIAPFNFPGMIPFWYLPYAVACGNTFIVKPSERVPLTMSRSFELVEQLGFPKGVLNLVNGGKEAVNAMLDHPLVRASALSAPPRWRVTFTAGPLPTANALSARAGQKTR